MSNVIHLFPKPEGGLVHVDLSFDGQHLEVMHESRSGESFALLDRFDLDEREHAVASALLATRQYGHCKLGRVA